MKTHKQKLIIYLKKKGISQDKFSRTCDVSSGFLRQGRSFSIELLPKIRRYYSDLSLNWLLFDEGNMLLSSDSMNNVINEPTPVYKKENNNCEKKIMELQNKVILIQDNLIEAQQTIQSFQKTELEVKKSNKPMV